MQRNKTSFKGQNIFIGIDVHKKTWSVTCLTQAGFKHTYAQKASAADLAAFLHRNFPEGDYQAVYESGFTGFSTYYALKEHGINCIVTHASDVPTTQYENVMKTDRVDSEKLARALRNGALKPVYVREIENLDDRGVVRIRAVMVNDLARYKSRVKHLLMSHGVEIPEYLISAGKTWSKRFIVWLREEASLLGSTRHSLDMLIDQVERLRDSQLAVTRQLRQMSVSDKYRDRYRLLLSVPGIGCVVAMTLLTEIYDVHRFSNQRQFAHYLGLVPTSHSSGDKSIHGKKTFRGNKEIGPKLIEGCWKAIRKDPGLGALYATYCQSMHPNKAIVKIARKLSNIIFSVLKNEKAYVPYPME